MCGGCVWARSGVNDDSGEGKEEARRTSEGFSGANQEAGVWAFGMLVRLGFPCAQDLESIARKQLEPHRDGVAVGVRRAIRRHQQPDPPGQGELLVWSREVEGVSRFNLVRLVTTQPMQLQH